MPSEPSTELPLSTITLGCVAVERRTLIQRLLGRRGVSRPALDILVDGSSLHAEFNRHTAAHSPYVCPLGWPSCAYVKELRDELLLRRAASLPDDRRPLFGCWQCSDPWCGVISVVVEQCSKWTYWRDFGAQAPSAASVRLDEFEDIGPFRFATRDYEAALLSSTAVSSAAADSGI